ncbi:hypothetical protein CB0940_05196 [Cercospora beticola]|uniref:AB hydrolase-1 domain-containing protein n=1 Tax=Cercospora beticola TaxID=122368 RepID=A0A2G5HMH2_CERBT|nr:hypothetical protein CB0940_05196 [Cercospora beticola]PIA93747.1 hypothetical protein CB0940_05196 [Cercospora beticola]WPB02513.1 hypothetical protein RHO25_007149 [Cercospora beticola]
MQAIRTLGHLRWSTQAPQARPLPPHIKREFVQTESGDLELLVCEPKSGQAAKSGVFFVHGGYGSAGVWLEWMNYLFENNYPGRLYAYSARNHGASFAVSYLDMVFRTSLNAIASDLTACVNWAESDNEGGKLVLVGHSSGGGLSQYCLAKNLVTAHALCLVGAIPHFGMLDMYWNWFKHDPFFPLRSMLHFGHPTSPLSTPDLVHGAFFGRKYPQQEILSFMRWIPWYESMGWPVAMFGSFVGWLMGKNTWLGVSYILRNIELSRNAFERDAVCVLVGLQDMLFDMRVIRRVATEYREGLKKMRESQGASVDAGFSGELAEVSGAVCESKGGVRVVLIEDAGHHVQNDVQTDIAAETLLSWLKQVS